MNVSPAKVDAVVFQAEQLLTAGRAEAAAALLEPVARAFPRAQRAQVILARSLRDMGQTDAALAGFKKAAEAGKDAPRWQEFIEELLKAGQKSRARKAAKNAPLRGPKKKALMELAKSGLRAQAPTTGGAPKALLQEVQSLLQSGQLAAAVSKAEEGLKQFPKSAFLHNALGAIAMARREYPKAETHFRDTLVHSPDFNGAAANLGLSLTSQEKHTEAVRVLRQAVANDPVSLEPVTNLANAYLRASQFEEALFQANRGLEKASNDVECLKIKVTALMKMLRFEDALDTLETLRGEVNDEPSVLEHIMSALTGLNRNDEAVDFARRHMEKSPEIARQLGTLLAEMGDIAQAKDVLAQTINRNPADAHAYFRYGALGKWDPSDPILAKLRDFVGNRTDSDQKGMEFYALSKACLDIKDNAEGFQVLHHANKAQGKAITFDPHMASDEFASIKEQWNAATYSTLTGTGVESVAPIFVIGMPRSGSTLTEQIIEAHPMVKGVGEDSVVSPFFPIEITAERNSMIEAAKKGASALRNVSSTQRIVDKYLNNSLRLGALAAAFPNAVFVQTNRDPRAIALSIYANPMRVLGHPYSTDLEHIAHIYIEHVRLMDHWRSFLGPRNKTVDYEHLVTNPETHIRALIKDVDLVWDDACLRPNAVAKRIKTLSFAQVRSDIGTQSAARWRAFEDELAPFTERVKDAGLLDQN